MVPPTTLPPGPPAGPDIETLIDGPTAYGDWNARERSRLRTVVRLGLKLVGLVWFLILLQLFVTKDSALVLLFSISLVYAVGAGVLSGEGRSARGYVVIALYGAFGAVAGTALHYARQHPAYVSMLLLPTALVAAGACVAVTNGFVGWCCAVQDRDVLVRRRWRRAWQRGDVPKGASLREATAALYGLIVGPVGMFVVFLFADPLGHWSRYAPLLPFGLFLLGCVVGLLTRTATPWGLVAVSFRAVVVWLTYASGREATGRGTYRFTPPFGDPRLRRLLVAAAVLLAGVSAIGIARWPTPIKEVPPSELALPGFTRDLFCVAILRTAAPRTPPPSVADVIADSYLPFAASAVGMTALPFLYLFLTFAGTAGPALALYYREFAANAVAVAERSSPRAH